MEMGIDVWPRFIREKKKCTKRAKKSVQRERVQWSGNEQSGCGWKSMHRWDASSYRRKFASLLVVQTNCSGLELDTVPFVAAVHVTGSIKYACSIWRNLHLLMENNHCSIVCHWEQKFSWLYGVGQVIHKLSEFLFFYVLLLSVKNEVNTGGSPEIPWPKSAFKLKGTVHCWFLRIFFGSYQNASCIVQAVKHWITVYV